MEGWNESSTSRLSPMVRTPIPTPRGKQRPIFSVKVPFASPLMSLSSTTNNSASLPNLTLKHSNSTKKCVNNKLPIDISETSRLSNLLQAVSYGSIKPNISTMQRYTNQRRPFTSMGKVTCFYHSEKSPSFDNRPSTTLEPGARVPVTYQLNSPAAMLRSQYPADKKNSGNDSSSSTHNCLHENDYLETKPSPLTTQHLDSGLPPPRPWPKLFATNNVRPLTRHELSGTREPLVSNILRDARIGRTRPLVVASYDTKDGTRYVVHKNLVDRFNTSIDGHNNMLLKRQFAKQIKSLKTKYRLYDNMTDEIGSGSINVGRSNNLTNIPMHLRDRERLEKKNKTRGSVARRISSSRIRKNYKQETKQTNTMIRATKTRRKTRTKNDLIFPESSLIVDNRGPYNGASYMAM